jgi:hypothetical protein
MSEIQVNSPLPVRSLLTSRSLEAFWPGGGQSTRLRRCSSTLARRHRVIGSAFARMILNGEYRASLGRGAPAGGNGAQIIDITMDEGPCWTARPPCWCFLNLDRIRARHFRSSSSTVHVACLICSRPQHRPTAARTSRLFVRSAAMVTFNSLPSQHLRKGLPRAGGRGLSPEDIILTQIFCHCTGEHNNYAVDSLKPRAGSRPTCRVPRFRAASMYPSVFAATTRCAKPSTPYLCTTRFRRYGHGIVNAGMVGVYDDLEPAPRAG